ncbi:hypothetical protein PC510_003889 [Escherichia coli]|uniref:hypothetical protein n=1 Tax=Escherichia coli TaxID=562 RepID=UPI001BD58193|nr:hypothetical protein [Escherichia coli]EKI3096608.1 hypothetical protein [Escherichia coli]MBB9841300.1 hypothetical protein [Escherichia coli]MBS9328533.1 hypothetical protein [Escherichia coli]
MTPRELLDDVIGRFPVLLHDDDDALRRLLVQALGTYQDRAGVIRTVLLKRGLGESARELPDDFLYQVGVCDSLDGFICSSVIDGKLELELCGCINWPLKFRYLVNLREMDIETGTVPPNIIGMVSNYLEILIKIPNTDRLRTVSIAGKLDVSTLPDDATLYERKTQLENDMANLRAILPMFSIYPY